MAARAEPTTTAWFDTDDFARHVRQIGALARSRAVLDDCRVALGEEAPRQYDSRERACQRCAREIADQFDRLRVGILDLARAVRP